MAIAVRPPPSVPRKRVQDARRRAMAIAVDRKPLAERRLETLRKLRPNRPLFVLEIDVRIGPRTPLLRHKLRPLPNLRRPVILAPETEIPEIGRHNSRCREFFVLGD